MSNYQMFMAFFCAGVTSIIELAQTDPLIQVPVCGLIAIGVYVFLKDEVSARALILWAVSKVLVGIGRSSSLELSHPAIPQVFLCLVAFYVMVGLARNLTNDGKIPSFVTVAYTFGVLWTFFCFPRYDFHQEGYYLEFIGVFTALAFNLIYHSLNIWKTKRDPTAEPLYYVLSSFWVLMVLPGHVPSGMVFFILTCIMFLRLPFIQRNEDQLAETKEKTETSKAKRFAVPMAPVAPLKESRPISEPKKKVVTFNVIEDSEQEIFHGNTIMKRPYNGHTTSEATRSAAGVFKIEYHDPKRGAALEDHFGKMMNS